MKALQTKKASRPFVLRFLLCAALLFLAIAAFVGCRWNHIKLHYKLKDFSETLEQETLDGLTLTIYYVDPSTEAQYPISVSRLLEWDTVQAIVVDSEDLKEHIDSLKRLNADNLAPVRYKSYLDARMCYIFETDSKGKILEVAFGGFNESPTVFVNGIEVAYNDVFRAIIEPFVTEEVMADMEYIYRGEIKPGPPLE